jgi:uncharacterized repeat protein (TIGR01451 family)
LQATLTGRRGRRARGGWRLLAGIMGALVGSGVAHAGHVPPGRHVLYVPLPAGVSERDLRSMDGAAKARLDAVVASHAWQRHAEQPLEDAVVIFTQSDGEPILPELAAARRASSQPGASATSTANDLAFTFDSPLYPWRPEDVTALRTAVNAFYPTAKAIYGAPAFAITVNVRRNPTNVFLGEYNATLNEIVLSSSSDLTVLCHEMIHAFRDDDLIALSSYEEGMTRAAEVEVFSRLAPAYEHTFDQNHGYTYDVFYEALNQPAIGARGGAFFAGYVSVLLRYQLAGYAWAKGLLENPRFFSDFNTLLYASILNDPAVRNSESKLSALAATVQPTIEGEPFDVWYARQSVLDTDPPTGYLLYQRVNQFTVDLFSRDGATGSEVMQPNASIQWALYDDDDALLGNGSDVTSANGYIDFLDGASTALAGYTGRVKVVASANTPAGTIRNTAWTTAGSARGVFGVVPDGNEGTVTITPLDDVASAVTVDVAHGAFAAPSLGGSKGRFVALFDDASGWTRSRQFTKDAADYFVLIAGAGTVADLGISVAPSRRTCKTGGRLTYALTVRNGGPDEASEVVVTTSLPVGARFVNVTGPGACVGPDAGGVLTCPVGSLGSGATSTLSVVVDVTAPPKSVLRTTSRVSASSTDPASSNDVVAVTTKTVGKPLGRSAPEARGARSRRR